MTGILYDPLYLEHLTGPGHPERPERCTAIMDAIEAGIPADRRVAIAARDASREELLRVHTPGYLASVQADIEADALMLSTGDTPLCSRSWVVAVRAAGGVMAAVDAVMRGHVTNAFCVVRPPGHHAAPERGMGFCIFNNVAVAVRHLQAVHGIERILIVDWDVHHGNGTQDAFYDDPNVFFFSTHAFPFYPGTGRRHETGRDGGRGATVNVPLAAGACGQDIIPCVRYELARRMQAFQPEFVFISAGFDARVNEALGNFCLTDTDFAELTTAVMALAAESAGGRIVSVLEGGYTLAGLASSAVAHVKVLAQCADPRHAASAGLGTPSS